jgi:Domain of unknown function (DUF4136)
MNVFAKEAPMKKHVKPVLILMLLGALIALAKEVVTDYDHSADFSQYKTYSWLRVKAPDPLWVDRITRAIDAELVAKGWSKVDGDGDAGVAAFGSSREIPTLTTFYDGVGGRWFWRGFGGIATTTVEETPVGTLVVDLFDGHTGKLVWRGVARDALSGKPEKDEKKLEKAAADMFKHFPPVPRG